MTDKQQPLWEVMYKAYYDDEPFFDDHHGYAAEIEALADWLVPEESEPIGAGHPFSAQDDYEFGKHEARKEIRQRLLDEALRAREGQGNG